MTRKDLFLLVFPAVSFMLLGVMVVICAEMVDTRFFAPPPPIAQKNFERFATDVRSGADHETTESWLKMLGSARESKEDLRQSSLRVARFQRIAGWGVVGIAVAQIALICSVRRRLRPNQRIGCNASFK
jgi:hypothetical protein